MYFGFNPNNNKHSKWMRRKGTYIACDHTNNGMRLNPTTYWTNFSLNWFGCYGHVMVIVIFSTAHNCFNRTRRTKSKVIIIHNAQSSRFNKKPNAVSSAHIRHSYIYINMFWTMPIQTHTTETITWYEYLKKTQRHSWLRRRNTLIDKKTSNVVICQHVRIDCDLQLVTKIHFYGMRAMIRGSLVW